MNIIDQKFGTEKHGVPTYDAICIGTLDEKNECVDFVCEFNTLNPFYKGNVTTDDSIAGHMSISVDKTNRLRKQILTFIPPSHHEIKRAIHDHDQIMGEAVLEFTKNFGEHPIQIRYQMEYKKNKALVKKIHFKLSVKQLKESSKVVKNIEEDRINQLLE